MKRLLLNSCFMTILTTSIVSPVLFEIRDAFYVSFLPFLLTFSRPPGSLMEEMNKTNLFKLIQCVAWRLKKVTYIYIRYMIFFPFVTFVLRLFI